MSQHLPSVTVIIAARPGQADVKAVTAARLLRYPPDKLDIIVARGRQPSVQRNNALRAATGELIYFLDDDSVPAADNLTFAIPAFQNDRVMMVGGPNLCPPDAPALEQVFALVHASWLAFGPSRARYSAVGQTRDSGEKELILCNLLARRLPVLALGGFNEALYPNEENALMDALQKNGGRLLYHPEFQVLRRPRNTLAAFARMLVNYGRGRAEQFRLHPTFGSAPNFVPPLFLVYLWLLGLTFLLPPQYLKFWLAPMAGYFIALLVQALFLVPQGGVMFSLGAIPLIFLTHLLYGLGFWRGLFTRLNQPVAAEKTTVILEKINLSTMA